MGRLVYRGGSCFSDPRSLRSANRFEHLPVIRFGSHGFRVVEDIGDARYRVICGGSWDNVSCPSSATRSVNEPGSRCIYLGFRVVEDIDDARYHVIRGGSWKRNPGFLRSEIRFGIPPVIRFNTHGFRIAEDIGNDRYRIIRGGSWNNNPRSLRSAFRFRFEVSCPSSATRSVNEPGSRCIYLGFRVVEDL